MLTNQTSSSEDLSELPLNEPDNQSISQIIAELLMLQNQGKLECIFNQQLMSTFGFITDGEMRSGDCCMNCHETTFNSPEIMSDLVMGECLIVSPKFVIKNPYAAAYNKLF